MVQWLRMQAIGMEALGLNSAHDQLFFPTFFIHLFYPMVTALLQYLDLPILHLFGSVRKEIEASVAPYGLRRKN